MADSSIKQFSFDQGDDGVGSKVKRWKGVLGKTDRFSFIFWEGLDKGKPDMDQPAPKFVGAQTHYFPNIGYIINKGPEFTKLAGEPPRFRIATAVVVWPTDNKGNIDKNRLAAGDAEVKVWLFSNDKYNQLKQIHTEFPFGGHDITVNCTEVQYQKLTMSPCRESLLRKLMENEKAKDIYARIITDAQNVISTIQNEVGKEMTIEQLKEKLAGGGGTPAAAVASGGAATSDIDGLVDGLLDG